MKRTKIPRPLLVGVFVLSPILLLLAIVLFLNLTKQPPPPPRGEILFSENRPQLDASPSNNTIHPDDSFDWIHERVDGLMTWDKNPWKRQRNSFGDRYLKLQSSDDPDDQAEAAQIREWAHALYLRTLERYPELAVEYKNISPEENGFLKFLDFYERMAASDTENLNLSNELNRMTDEEAEWNPDLFRTWREQNPDILADLLAIGLTGEQSVFGIEVSRYSFLGARTAMNGTDALLLNARLSLDEGDTVTALQSVRAVRGLADHFTEVETPTLLSATISILINHSISRYALTDLLPAVPPEQADPSAWEEALRPQLAPPSEFARLMVGEWHVISQEYFFPALSDSLDPKYPSDPGALIDYYASNYLNVAQAYSSNHQPDWISATSPGFSSPALLSRESRKHAEIFSTGAEAWSKGYQRSNHQTAMVQAAFAIMKDEPIPADPVYDLPYQWDPATRVLSPPISQNPMLKDGWLHPITVPLAR
ncbi:hypothetical protein [Roseibacillus persicicus]|uniref:hypothetical protein n=1 Tax=Roseibacillus persicicus TaxID=454148 RepID=UPI00280E9D44|nr:hypothetical protein [Roseibacillus persicicus]MDQ8192312.1 hypothetical protein [Roseibacillus persicicus]